MIKMISGTTRVGARTYNSASEPFSADASIEKRLVKLGVAEYVKPPVYELPETEDEDDDTLTNGDDNDGGESAVATPVGDENGNGEGDNPPEDESDAEGADSRKVKPAYSADMKVDDLKELLKAAGLPVKTAMAKVDIIAMLDAFYADPEDDDDSELPDLGASEPVS